MKHRSPATLLRRLVRRARPGRPRRVPVLLQLSAIECGAACLAMVLSAFGRPTSVAACRARLGVGRDGVSALGLARAGRAMGLRVRAFSLEPAALAQAALPAIAHWNFNHFVVVERVTARHVQVVDPALGRRRLSHQQFGAGFTGVVLTFEPDPDAPPAERAPRRQIWRGYLRAILSQPGALLQVAGGSLALQLLGLALPLFTKVLIDDVLPQHDAALLTALGLGVAMLVISQTVLAYLRSTLLVQLQTRLDRQLTLGFFAHLLALPFRFFEQRTSGDLLMRLSSNALIRETLTSQTTSVALDVLFLLGYMTLLLARAPLFGAVVLAFGALQVLLMLISARALRDLTHQDMAAQSESHSYLVEAVSGIATVKAAGSEPRIYDRWAQLYDRQIHTSVQRFQLNAQVDTLLSGLRAISPIALLWLGAWQVLGGAMSLGTLLALNTLAGAVLAPLASLVSSGQRLYIVGAHLERIADVLEAAPEQPLDAPAAAQPLRGQITLDAVSFRYDPHGPLVLRDISLDVAPGQKVALVGRTGSGKTTLARLLLGLYPPSAGQIRFDGAPLEQLDLRALRQQCGVVLQDPFLFSGSLRHNIALNDPTMPLGQVEAAARLAAIHDDIAQMPMGYETLLAEGGGGLSGGQRQRIALARALAHRPALLLLDEATSHLDVTTEQVVDRNLSQLACTRIVIAHRLSTVRNADLIVVLEGGAIVERGTHAQLLARGGAYAQLVRSQSTDDLVAPHPPGLPAGLQPAVAIDPSST